MVEVKARVEWERFLHQERETQGNEEWLEDLE